MSKPTPADLYMVSVNRRKHVRHLTTRTWVRDGDQQWASLALVCSTGAEGSEYVVDAGNQWGHLPICRRCKRRLTEYIENVQREGEAL